MSHGMFVFVASFATKNTHFFGSWTRFHSFAVLSRLTSPGPSTSKIQDELDRWKKVSQSDQEERH
jgi:hypothetical protein